ncbi:calycin-like domain-containing protein [Prevotellamassilia timonensis]|uniref:calycin-like domain-containing protein n=1 Tax=Prevotellamassilia timonensis TaxID=1852370 RepID=UPI0030775048
MKKQLLTLALLAVAGTAGAQQLPNVGFDGWKTACGKTFQASDKSEKQRPGVEPEGWNGSNVKQSLFGQTASEDKLVTQQKSDGRGKYVKLANRRVEKWGVGATAPAYLTFGTPWSYPSAIESEQDGGTFGGVDFKYRPDAIKGMYKRTNVNGKTEKAHIIVYLWTGTFTSKIGKGGSPSINKENVDRAIMGKSNAGTITGDGKLVASADHEFATTKNNDWEEIIVPIVYNDKTTIPTKMNVVISSADYWTRSNIIPTTTGVDGSVLEADDIEFVYYHTLKSATYDGQAIENFAENTLNYDLSSQVYDEKKFDCTVKGIGAEAVKSYNEATGLLTVTVNGNNISDDATSKTVYTFQFKKVDYTGVLSALSVNGKNIKTFAEGSYHYTVVGDYADGCVTATAKGADDVVATNYDAATRICSINVTGGSKANTYFVKFAKATTDYKGKMSIAMVGQQLLSAATSTVGITTPVDNKADFQLLGFALGEMPVGDIFVTDVPYAEENGVVNLYKEQTITIFGDNSEGMGLIDLPVVLTGTLKDGKLTANIGITWNGEKITVDLVPLDATSLDLSSNAVNLEGTPLADMKADMTNKNLTIFLPEATEGVDAKEKNVVVGTTASSLSLTDGNDWGVTKDFTAAAVSYDRVFNTDANYVQSFVLPFGFTVPTDATVAELSSVNGDNLVFKPVAETVANKPYLVVTTDADFINKLTNVQVKATTGADLTTTVDGVSHIGSYTAQNVTDAYGYANGKFVKANTGSVKPFRTYVKVAGAQGAAPMAFGVNIEGTVTGINNATTAATAKEAIYNLQGVRVSGDLKHLAKGVYIVNGQKVVVK